MNVRRILSLSCVLPFVVIVAIAVAGCGAQQAVQVSAASPEDGTNDADADANDTEGSEADAAKDEGAEQSKSRKSAKPFPGGRIVDLTYTFDEHTIYWPNAAGFKLTVDSAKVTEKGYYYAANHFAAAEHGGTHIDAPIHFAEGHETVDKIPLERLISEAVLVDVTRQCAADRDYQIGVADLRGWEERHERQLVDVILLLRTGNGRNWPDAEKYLGTAEKGAEAIPKLHFPGLSPEAARWLVENRAVKAVGIDTASIDYGQSQLFETHVTLYSHNLPALENVANLDKLPETGFNVIALPMKIGGGSGGPLRIVAIVP